MAKEGVVLENWTS